MKKHTSPYQAASEEKRAQLIEKIIQIGFLPKYSASEIKVPFGEVLAIWADFAMEELKAKGGSLLDILSPEAKGHLKNGLMAQLSDRCGPTLNGVLLLIKEKNGLKGETAEERYAFFIEKVITQPEFLKEIFKNCPFFAQSISSQILLWIDQAFTFISRLNKDYQELETTFLVRGKVIAISPGLSALHNGNKTVYQLIFENNISLFYKPKSLKLAAAYNQFLAKLNQLDIEPKLKTYQVLLREQYGWVEFVKTLSCQREEEVKQFFQKFGMVICLIFLLEGRDCHSENIIASGSDPILIDLESLFQPTIRTMRFNSKPEIWNQSVFRTGFLPSPGPFLQKMLDESPLSSEEEQEIPTDHMEMVKVRVPRPKLHGKIVSTANYVKELLAGFEKMYLLFATDRNQIVPWINDLFPYPVRVVFRPSRFYNHIQKMLMRAQLSPSEQEAEMPLKLLTHLSPIQNYPHLKKITDYEREALLHGDIPYFLSFPENCHLYIGDEILASDLFIEPAKNKVLENIQNLNDKEMRRQLEYIDRSLLFLKFAQREKTYTYHSYERPAKVNPLAEKDILHIAEKIGHQILALAEPLPDGTNTWISLEFDLPSDHYLFQPLSSYLHSGEAGIALFFASLGKGIGNPMFIEQAKRILQRLREPFYEDKDNTMHLTPLGGMVGLGGLIYTYALIGQILGEPEYLKDAGYFASLISKEKISQETNFDLVQGSAGLILSLLSLYEKTGEKSLLEKAKEVGGHILKKGRTEDSGLSHGTAGIAYALVKLGAQLNNPSIMEAAEKALNFDCGSESGQYSWCHGAPGIALARLYIQKFHPGLPQDQEIQSALAATQSHLVGNLDHLCCGNFGRLAILWDAAHLLKQNDLKEIVLSQTTDLLSQYAKTYMFKLLPDEKMQTPGFMRGLSGIGYFLLRLTKAGKELPEVLILE